MDIKYNVVAAELDSQGFDMRKRVKMTSHKSAWGLHSYDPKYETAMNVQDEIGKARGGLSGDHARKSSTLRNELLTAELDQVKSAYKQIAQDNDTIRKNARPTKRSTYDPSPLIFTPRKRHNSRWPVTPPTWEAMIAEWQPLIVFEIDISEIDDPAFWEQENAMALEQHEQDGQQLAGKRSKKRRSIVQRPSLSTISEERKEPSGVPAKYRPMYSAPSKRWAAAAEKYFTITATPTGVTVDDAEGDENSRESSGIEITNHRGHFRVPSSPLSSRSANTAASNRETQDPVDVTNERGRFRAPSSPLSSRSASTTASSRKRRAQNDHIDQRSPVRRRSLARESSPSPTRPATDSTAVAVFDQPTPKVHTEPEHETKRRVSLDNARRSDRPLQMTAFKKVRTWAASTFTGRRRSFAEAMEEQNDQDDQEEPPRTRRRHTLDVDVGRNPDIFGQTAGREQEHLPDSNALRSTAPDTVLPGPIAQPEIQAEDARTPPIENGTTSVGVGAAKNIDDKAGNLLSGKATLAAQEDSLSEVDTEFSMARNANDEETATSLEDPATSPGQKTVGIDWNAITNVDDKIRDLLDRKADLVFSKDDPVGKDDDGDTLLSDGDETQPFEESVLNRIMSVLESDEDEDITMGSPQVDTLAPKLHVANPPATDPFMADSPIADSPAVDSPVPGSPIADLPTVMEVSVDAVANTAMADVHVSGELAAMPQPVESSEHDVATTIIESAATIDTPISEEHGATPQPLEVSDDDSHDTAAIIENTTISDTSISDEPAAVPQSAEAPDQNLFATTQDEAMQNASTSEQPVTASQPEEAGDRASHTGAATTPTAQPQTVEAQDGDPNDDSQLELLHSFVRRAQMKPKRRESMTLFTGSPRAHVEPSMALKSPRQPLGQKDANMSPSPGKKRKLKEVEEAPLDMTKTSRLVKPDLEDNMPQPLRKRRRKGGENDSPDEIFNPDMAMSQSLTQRGSSGGPRRSKRVATTKPAEPITPSHIPVRLPGSFDADMPAISTAGLMQRKTEKDLATLTRTNTRRNKGPALPVPARLAGLSLPADVAADPFVSPDKATGLRASRRGKSVRWDETLARFQGDDGGNPPVAAAAAAVAAETAVPAVVEEPITPGPVPVTAPVASSAPASAPPESEKKKALRPRPSRLPAAVTKTATTPKTLKTPKPKAAPTPSRVTPTPTRRSGALGARLGTPAAKRRGSARA